MADNQLNMAAFFRFARGGKREMLVETGERRRGERFTPL